VVTVADRSTGIPANDVEVWNNMVYGGRILMGKTGHHHVPDGSMEVVGIHIGDRITAGSGTYVVTAADIAFGELDETLRLWRYACPDPLTHMERPLVQIKIHIDTREPRFQVGIQPGKEPSSLLIEIKPSLVGMSGAAASVVVDWGQGKPVSVPLARSGDLLVGTLRQAPRTADMTFTLSAKDSAGKATMYNFRARIATLPPKQQTEAGSVDGTFSLSFPPQTMAGAYTLTIGPSLEAAPPGIILGPFHAGSSDSPNLKGSATLRFHVDVDPKGGKDTRQFQILQLDPAGKGWQSVGPVVFNPSVGVVSAKVNGLGTFALVGHAAVNPNKK